MPNATHLHIAKLPIKKHHINVFCMYAGLILMGTDAIVANVLHEYLGQWEGMFAAGGKWGATLAVIPAILETSLRSVAR